MRMMTRLLAEYVDGDAEGDSILLDIAVDDSSSRVCEGHYYGLVRWGGSRYPVELNHAGHLYFGPEESDSYTINIFEKDIREGELLTLNVLSNGKSETHIYRIIKLI